MIPQSIAELVGRTPLLELNRIRQAYAPECRLLAKLEYFNPTGSVKDRASLAMIEDAERSGLLQPGGVIIEPTSGNTGIGLAAIGAARGYRVILTMPDTMSKERLLLLAAYGAELVLTPGADGMPGAIRKAEELLSAMPGSFGPGQFANPANPAAHIAGTGPELWAQTEGVIDVFVAGVGTGGTVTGVGGFLKQRKPGVYIVAVEPARSPVLSGGERGPHDLQGIGAGFVPDILDTSVYDEILTVEEQDAYRMGREAARKEGILVGITSGAALHAAITLGNRPAFFGKTIVTLLPDAGGRYLSSAMFEAQ